MTHSRRLLLAAFAAAVSTSLLVLRRHRRRLSVANSARSVCAARAVESASPDALFTDPFAAAFAGEHALARVRARRGRRLDQRIAVRTRWFDDALLAALAASPGAQVVLLGAGFDARAWRLKPPTGVLSKLIVEVDTAAVSDEKATALAALPGGVPQLTLGARYATVTADLSSLGWPAALARAGHDPRVPTVWVLEGLLYYLPSAAAEVLLQKTASLSAPGSALLCSACNSPAVARAKRSQSAAMRCFQSSIDEPKAELEKSGWELKVATRPGEADCSYGRVAQPAPHEAGAPRAWYIAATVA